MNLGIIVWEADLLYAISWCNPSRSWAKILETWNSSFGGSLA